MRRALEKVDRELGKTVVIMKMMVLALPRAEDAKHESERRRSGHHRWMSATPTSPPSGA
jgi:hypothetical protein